MIKAVLGNDTTTIKNLINEGYDVNETFTDRILCTSNPLHFAASNGSVNAAKILIENGADINITNSFDDTPLHIAAGMMPHYNCDLRITKYGDGSFEVAKLLIDSQADLNIKNFRGMSPVHNAALNGRFDIIKILIEHGVDVNIGNNECGTPFVLCGNIYNIKPINNLNSTLIARYLVNKGANINATTKDKKTAIHMAAFSGNVDHIKYLIELGLNINAQDENGDTPLHEAAFYCQHDTVKILLQNGAQVHIKNKDNQTPKERAMQSPYCKKNDRIFQLMR